MYKNSFEEDVLISYSEKYTTSQLIEHMLIGVVEDNCCAKADAHMALCIKMYLKYGNYPELAYNCYDDEQGMDSDFYLFRAHTRQLTDYLDEQLNWDMKSVNKELVKKAEDMFMQVVLEYKFKEFTLNLYI